MFNSYLNNPKGMCSFSRFVLASFWATSVNEHKTFWLYKTELQVKIKNLLQNRIISLVTFISLLIYSNYLNSRFPYYQGHFCNSTIFARLEDILKFLYRKLSKLWNRVTLRFRNKKYEREYQNSKHLEIVGRVLPLLLLALLEFISVCTLVIIREYKYLEWHQKFETNTLYGSIYH